MKYIKIIIISSVCTGLGLWWLIIALTQSYDSAANYWWQAGLAFATALVGLGGFSVAKNYSWLKSGVGKGITFISIGMITWSLGQAGWAYYYITQPFNETPDSPIIELLYLVSIPLWGYGIMQLSRATGAKYALRKTSGKVFALSTFIVMFTLSYIFLVNIARGGLTEYFDASRLPEGSLPLWWLAISDLGFVFADVVLVSISLSVIVLSWKQLGGKFRVAIRGVLVSFIAIYFADFFFSLYDAKGEYFNGHWIDLLFSAVVHTFGVSLLLLDPKRVTHDRPQTQPNEQQVVAPQTGVPQ